MINLNKADEKGLMKIIHIGKVRAKLIIEQRKNNEPQLSGRFNAA